MKLIKLSFLILLLASSQAFAKVNPKESKVDPSDLFESYHRVETFYQVSQVQPALSMGKSTLQNFIISGNYTITPRVSLAMKLPIISLAKDVALSNPYFGAQGSIFQGLIKDFPTFVNFNAGIRFPLSSNSEFVFDRTDVILGFSSLREIHHLSLFTDLQYTIKIDPDNSLTYGNAWSAKVGGELSTGHHISPGVSLNYRRSGVYKSKTERLSGRSLMIIQPSVSYHRGSDVTLKTSFSSPLGRQNLDDTLKTFGDYTISGIGGNTFFLSFEKKF